MGRLTLCSVGEPPTVSGGQPVVLTAAIAARSSRQPSAAKSWPASDARHKSSREPSSEAAPAHFGTGPGCSEENVTKNNKNMTRKCIQSNVQTQD